MTNLLYTLMSLLKHMVTELTKMLWQLVKAWGKGNVK